MQRSPARVQECILQNAFCRPAAEGSSSRCSASFLPSAGQFTVTDRTPNHLTEISTPLPWANKQREEEEGARRWEILTTDRWKGCKRGGGGGAGGGWKQIFSDSSPLPSGVCVPPSSEGSHGGVKTPLPPPSPALCLLYFMLPSSPPPPHSA